MREITASGLFDNHLRQQSCLSWLSKNPRRLFHDKPGKTPDYSLNNIWLSSGLLMNSLQHSRKIKASAIFTAENMRAKCENSVTLFTAKNRFLHVIVDSFEESHAETTWCNPGFPTIYSADTNRFFRFREFTTLRNNHRGELREEST